ACDTGVGKPSRMRKRRPQGRLFFVCAISFRLGERHCDELRRLRALHLQQHAALAGRFRLLQLGPDVVDAGDGLATGIEDDVAGLDATACRRAFRINGGDDDALLARALYVAGRSKAEAETRRAGGRLTFVRLVIRLRLTLVRELAEVHAHSLAL